MPPSASRGRARTSCSTAGCSRACRSSCATRATALDRWATPEYVRACERFFDDLSNWYVRSSRARFWAGDRTAFAVLHHALERVARVIAPAMPFLAEELWEGLIVDPLGDAAPDSVHLAGFPEVDGELLDERAARGDGRCPRGRGARTPGACGGQAAPATAVRVGDHRVCRPRGRSGSREPLGRDRARAERQAARVRIRRGLPGRAPGHPQLPRARAAHRRPRPGAEGRARGRKLRTRRRGARAGRRPHARAGRLRAARAPARGLRGGRRRPLRGRGRHPHHRRARARGARTRCRPAPAERPQGARLRGLGPDRRAVRDRGCRARADARRAWRDDRARGARGAVLERGPARVTRSPPPRIPAGCSTCGARDAGAGAALVQARGDPVRLRRPPARDREPLDDRRARAARATRRAVHPRVQAAPARNVARALAGADRRAPRTPCRRMRARSATSSRRASSRRWPSMAPSRCRASSSCSRRSTGGCRSPSRRTTARGSCVSRSRSPASRGSSSPSCARARR